MTRGTTISAMKATIYEYYDGCNEADHAKMTGTMAPEAVHYFPAGAPQGPFIGANAIADGWVAAVNAIGSQWSIESYIADEATRRAVVEWTHWKTKQGIYLRGDEWFEFDQQGRITEIRAYYACPPASGTQESSHLGGFDYANRGFQMEPPLSR